MLGNFTVAVDVKETHHALRLLLARSARRESLERVLHILRFELLVTVAIHLIERDDLAQLTPAPTA